METVDIHKRTNILIRQNVGSHSAPLSRRLRIQDANSHGHITEPAGTRTADLELLINVEKLVNALADKALTSSARRSIMQGGAIQVRVIKGTEVEAIIPHIHTARCFFNGATICGHEGRAS